jgi:serine/threonine protein kinase
MIDNAADDIDPLDQLGIALRDYYTRLERGEEVDREAFLNLYPDQAEMLQEHWGGIDRLEQIVNRLPSAVRIPSIRPVQLPCEFAGYELVEEIGRGGMGVVYRAIEVATGRVLAIKMILTGHLASTEEIERFRGEAAAAAKLRHPGIVPIYHFGAHAGQHYFTMPLVEGESLADRLADGPLPWREAAELAATVAEAIDFAHERGVVHRDLKPANILLDRDGRPMISDFGLARRLGDESIGLTTTGNVVGTASYMSPEQACGQLGLIGPSTDIYGLGAMLYAMVTGHAPFRSANLRDAMQEVCERVPESLRTSSRHVPPDLDTICQKCLEKEPRHRYASAADAAEDLRRLLRGEPIKARAVRWPERSWRWCRRNRPVAVLAGGILLSIMFGALAATHYARQAMDEARRARLAGYAARANASSGAPVIVRE